MLKRILIKALHQWRLIRNPIAYARWIGVRVGEGCRFVGLTTGTFGSEPYLVRIGNHVTLAAGVRFITHDGAVDILRLEDPELDVVAPVIIGDNVFVGTNALLLPGVTIGNNCVIAAGSVVTRDIPDGQVAAGVPARCIKTVAEYREKVRAQAFRARSRSAADKRLLWESHFFPESEAESAARIQP